MMQPPFKPLSPLVPVLVPVPLVSESMGRVDTSAISEEEEEVIEKREKNESIDVLSG